MGERQPIVVLGRGFNQRPASDDLKITHGP
jgi:hypothetical protein